VTCGLDAHEGGCFCGAVRYRVAGPIESVTHCHCQSCRRSAGAAFVTWFTVERGRVSWTKGEARQHNSSPGVVRAFCGDCGTELAYSSEQAPKTIDLTIGSLDCAAEHPAQKHIWVSNKLDWLDIDDALPHHKGWPTGG